MTQPRVAQIPALTGIRILAAAWVVVEHFRNVIYGMFPESNSGHVFIESGYLGVEVFFVLSGFIISHNYADRFASFSWGNYRRFLTNRFARLYPVHLVTLGVVALLVAAAALLHVALTSDGKYDPVGFVMNLLMLQAIPPAQAWNGPAWSISAEAGVYVLFPLTALLIARLRTRVGLVLGAATALTFTIAGEFAIQATSGFDPTGYPSIWVRVLGEFLTGSFVWALWRKADRSKRGYDAVAVAGVGGIIFVLALSHDLSAANYFVLPFVAIFIFGCAGATGPVQRFLASQPLEYGGRISYSLYMTHFLVLMVGGKLLPWERLSDASPLARGLVVGAYFLAAFAVAALVYRIIEEPGRLFIGRFVRRRTVRPAGEVRLEVSRRR